ncbi:glycine receptor subunit alpha-2-like isoform X2 [Biomphalaria glabrata]|uniref:Glycine receptor subunit alpha-2-like isoform X2 n=1 Tax=Biomphalaria glabrata TaxID=6526 RepID=A0A9W3B566_BIOGL|nr:glycine receptor subunit alpha-2-like isoform X2 [Biomphalaria glabrata]XP_055894621.1 glycine receptor subunit alpha-2-like isoform X2 [Biomphalaria glabrata]XP_055894622.1 glycine receptor subunit alpha-2-like isoform X2 [Biomphalaria glabrata]
MMGWSTWTLTVTLLLSRLCQVLSNSHQHTGQFYNRTRQDVLQVLLNNSSYNPRISPDYEQDHATIVDVQIYVLSIDTVSEQSMDYSMNIYLRQRWIDPRLQFVNLSKALWLEIDFKLMSLIWVPDTFFRNEKKGQFHDVTVPNRLMHLYRNGTIYYSMRLSVLLSCHMKLQKYPLDIQKCPIKIASYGYTMENIIYRWIAHKPIDYNEELQLSQYTLLTHTLDNCTKTYKETGSFSCVQANFILARDVGYYIIQVYVPSVLIVILSWVSFWLDVEAIPARISLGVLTVLTMTTQSSGARASLPRVSYVKAIDVWMAACLFFVFASLLEFAYINVLARRRVPYRCFSSPDSFDNTTENNGITDSEKGDKPKLARKDSKGLHLYGKQGARYIDRISRYLFPLAFIIFNLGYWLVYYFVDM